MVLCKQLVVVVCQQSVVVLCQQELMGCNEVNDGVVSTGIDCCVNSQ